MYSISNEEKMFIEEKLVYDKLFNDVFNTSKFAWGEVADKKHIRKWLNNFKGYALGNKEIEQRIALWLLYHSTYYTKQDLKALCKDVFMKYINKSIAKQSEISLSNRVSGIIDSTYYTMLGNPSESGAYILYLFRTENQIDNRCFEMSRKNNCRNLVFVDDAIFTGNQVSEYLYNYFGEEGSGRLNVTIATLFLNKHAIDQIKENNPNINLDFISSIELSERDQVFSEESYVFSQDNYSEIKEITKAMCDYYGEIVCKEMDLPSSYYPDGYEHGQYLISYEHNTPDNSLPILWYKSDSWSPMFERRHKIEGKTYEIDPRKFY